MKKLLFALLALPAVAMAQLKGGGQVAMSNFPKIQKEAQTPSLKPLSKTDFKSRFQTENIFSNKKTRATGKRYFIFPVDMDTFLVDLGQSPLFVNANLDYRYMWKDSLVKVNYSNGQSPAEVMSLSQVLDPYANRWRSSCFTGELQATGAYSVDTFGIVCGYFRVASKPNVVDTIRIKFVTSDQMGSLSYGPTTAIGTIYSDTVEFAGIQTDYASKGAISTSTTAPTVIVKDIYLNAASENDTLSSGFNYFETPVNMSLNNQLVGATVTFISGDPSIITNDTMPSYNRLRYATFGQGDGTNQQNMYYSQGDFNMSGNSWTTIPFGISAGGTERYYFPGIAYSDAVAADIIPWQYHWFVWTTTLQNAIGVGVNNQEIVLNDVKVYPNPVNADLHFGFNLKENASDVRIELRNTVGQVVKVVNLGNKVANASINAEINVADLADGMYIYTIIADGKTISNKVNIQ